MLARRELEPRKLRQEQNFNFPVLGPPSAFPAHPLSNSPKSHFRRAQGRVFAARVHWESEKTALGVSRPIQVH